MSSGWRIVWIASSKVIKGFDSWSISCCSGRVESWLKRGSCTTVREPDLAEKVSFWLVLTDCKVEFCWLIWLSIEKSIMSSGWLGWNWIGFASSKVINGFDSWLISCCNGRVESWIKLGTGGAFWVLPDDLLGVLSFWVRMPKMSSGWPGIIGFASSKVIKGFDSWLISCCNGRVESWFKCGTKGAFRVLFLWDDLLGVLSVWVRMPQICINPAPSCWPPCEVEVVAIEAAPVASESSRKDPKLESNMELSNISKGKNWFTSISVKCRSLLGRQLSINIVGFLFSSNRDIDIKIK